MIDIVLNFVANLRFHYIYKIKEVKYQIPFYIEI